jgi:hypothetical protein
MMSAYTLDFYEKRVRTLESCLRDIVACDRNSKVTDWVSENPLELGQSDELKVVLATARGLVKAPSEAVTGRG